MKNEVRLLYYILKNWLAYKFAVMQPVPIGYVILGVTYECNAQCRMCNIHSIYKEKPELQSEELDLSFLLGRLQESSLISKIEHIDLTGGEPFLKKNLAAFISDLFKLPTLKLVTLNSNGLLPDLIAADTEHILQSIPRDKSFSISISIDGIGNVHDRIRGLSGAFARLDKTIIWLKELRDGFPNFTIRSNAVIQLDNIACLNVIKDYWQRHGINGAFSLIQNPLYTRMHPPCGNDCFSKEDIQKIKSVEPKSRGMNYYLENSFRRPLHCFAGYSALFIDQFGILYPCNFLASEECYAMGDIKKESIDTIWMSSRSQCARARVKKCSYTSCWNGCEVDQTMIQFEAIERIVNVLSLGKLNLYNLSGLHGFK